MTIEDYILRYNMFRFIVLKSIRTKTSLSKLLMSHYIFFICDKVSLDGVITNEVEKELDIVYLVLLPTYNKMFKTEIRII